MAVLFTLEIINNGLGRPYILLSVPRLVSACGSQAMKNSVMVPHNV